MNSKCSFEGLAMLKLVCKGKLRRFCFNADIEFERGNTIESSIKILFELESTIDYDLVEWIVCAEVREFS